MPVDFPYSLVTILWENFSYQPGEDVERTTLDSGHIRQAETRSSAPMTREFDFELLLENFEMFMQFINTNTNSDIRWRDIDGTQRTVKLKGGAGAVRLAGQGAEPKPFLQGRIALEGDWT